MQSAIFFVPTRFYALFRADSRKIVTFYNHFSADFFVIFCGNVFSRQQNFLSLIRVFVLSHVRYNQGSWWFCRKNGQFFRYLVKTFCAFIVLVWPSSTVSPIVLEVCKKIQFYSRNWFHNISNNHRINDV